MKSYIKIYGPPMKEALKALEKIAVSMPEVCIMDTAIRYSTPKPWDTDDFQMGYLQTEEIPKERCNTIISKSAEELGEYDFFFEWFKNPNFEELNMLIGKIDEALAPLGCKYTITTR